MVWMTSIWQQIMYFFYMYHYIQEKQHYHDYDHVLLISGLTMWFFHVILLIELRTPDL